MENPQVGKIDFSDHNGSSVGYGPATASARVDRIKADVRDDLFAKASEAKRALGAAISEECEADSKLCIAREKLLQARGAYGAAKEALLGLL